VGVREMTAKVDIWMPLFYMEYEAATAGLTDEEDRAYRRLIVHYWHTGAALPDDDKRLAQIVHKSVRDWRKIRRVLVAFFTVKNGELHHKRIDKELSKARANKDFTVGRAKAGAAARWGKRDASSIASSIPPSIASSIAHNLNPPIGGLKKESPPDRGGDSSPPSEPKGSTAPAAPAWVEELRSVIVARFGDGYAASWLSGVSWQEVPARLILTATGVAADRLRHDFRKELETANIGVAKRSASAA
jgi:uncharacterized protein YdaU (DUF1376 family)